MASKSGQHFAYLLVRRSAPRGPAVRRNYAYHRSQRPWTGVVVTPISLCISRYCCCQLAGSSYLGWWGEAVGLSYADAVRLLGGRQSRTVAALDRLAGGLLLVASAAGSGFALSLFEAKGEVA